MKRGIFTGVFFLLVTINFTFAQNMISGNVIRENKKPLPGVKVSVEGVQGVETSTDKLGDFDIEVPVTAKILIFSYEGMKTQKIGLGKKSFISITMIEGVDEPVKPEPKKEEKPKDQGKTKTKEMPDTTASSKKTKEEKPKDNNKDKSKDNNKDKSKENSKDKSKSKDSKSTEAQDTETEITQPATTDEKEPAKTTTDTKKSKKSK
jgi:hypothetical protein